VLRGIIDLHDLADDVENPRPTKADLQKIYDAAYAKGVEDTESRQNGFHNATDELSWIDVALFVQRNKHHTDNNHHKFIDDMAERAKSRWPYEPTEKQHRYLHSLYSQIRRKIS